MRLISKLALFLVLSAVCAKTARAAEAEPAQAYAEEVYLTENSALKLAFAGCDRTEKKVHAFTKSEKDKIESRLGWSLSQSTVAFFQGYLKDVPAGRAIIVDEIGKFKPITFMVKVSNEGKVERVDVMVYRETVGSEVRRERFTRQFRGKTAKDPMRINRDILNLTGATMSVQAMTAGIKKALVILDEVHE